MIRDFFIVFICPKIRLCDIIWIYKFVYLYTNPDFYLLELSYLFVDMVHFG